MSQNLRILFLGPAGSGKGTQSAKLAEKFNIEHISTGDLIRAAIKSGSELGNKVKAIVEAGQLVSDDIVNAIVKEKVSNLNSFILDGYPRTLEQAKFFDGFAKFDFVFDLEVDKNVLVERLSGRRMCTKTKDTNCKGVFHVTMTPPKQESTCDLCGSDLYQRKDDSPEAIEKRLSGYQEETGAPLGEFYKSQIIKINGLDHPDQVFGNILTKLESVKV
ncbi:MAG: nucleoside monophosphate kinase [Candidatus Caenarcaniphilales bacterium]|jgi:adenylate kinase|nr:nucleoside monophosphate kinase [Candidatus Caenarcaniphilales bacterium]